MESEDLLFPEQLPLRSVIDEDAKIERNDDAASAEAAFDRGQHLHHRHQHHQPRHQSHHQNGHNTYTTGMDHHVISAGEGAGPLTGVAASADDIWHRPLTSTILGGSVDQLYVDTQTTRIRLRSMSTGKGKQLMNRMLRHDHELVPEDEAHSPFFAKVSIVLV